MGKFDSGDLQRYVDITSNFGTRATDFDYIGAEFLNQLIEGRDGKRS